MDGPLPVGDVLAVGYGIFAIARDIFKPPVSPTPDPGISSPAISAKDLNIAKQARFALPPDVASTPPPPLNPFDDKNNKGQQGKQQNNQYNLSQERFDHIMQRHGPESTKWGGKFAQNTSPDAIKNMINKAISKGIERPNGTSSGSIFEYNFKNSIGTNINGKITSSLRVVVDTAKNVKTAFPY